MYYICFRNTFTTLNTDTSLKNKNNEQRRKTEGAKTNNGQNR